MEFPQEIDAKNKNETKQSEPLDLTSPKQSDPLDLTSPSKNENNENQNAVVDHNDLSLDQANSLVKIYVGSMPPDLEEDGLKSLLSENSLPEPETVLVKRGYAFLEFTDQSKADVTISVVDGKKIERFFN